MSYDKKTFKDKIGFPVRVNYYPNGYENSVTGILKKCLKYKIICRKMDSLQILEIFYTNIVSVELLEPKELNKAIEEIEEINNIKEGLR